MLCGLIMAGGKGERFWPLSTEEKPKQFLNLLGEESMLQMTVKRMEKLIPLERIFIVTAEKYTSHVIDQLPNLPRENIIIEPEGKNTAPCIALSALVINKYYDNSTLVVVPSDHLIADEEEFINTLMAANKLVEIDETAIVTLGIEPDRPETGYGYINYGETHDLIENQKIKKVIKFKEKPDVQTAKRYLQDGNYLWNSGMFIWNCNTILKLTELYLNNTYLILSEIAAASEEEFKDKLDKNYSLVDSISIDYGIIENAKNVYVIPSKFGWDDIGTWQALERYREKDEKNNITIGKVKEVDGRNNIVIGNDKPIMVTGLDNIFIVETDEAILITDKQNLNNIKSIKKHFYK